MRHLALSIVLTLISLTAMAATHQVPGSFSTIQAGIDACAVGDTVLVAPGTYSGAGNTWLNFHGVDLVLLSEMGPDETIIDDEEVTRGIYLNSGETLASVVSGFTVKNCFGDDQPGAAVYCSHASLTLHSVVLANNTAEGYGAGVVIGFDSVVLNSVQFVDNIANINGGGLNAYQAEVVIESASFTGNRSGKGGAIYCRESNLTLSNSSLVGNQAVLYGGGIVAYDHSTVEMDSVQFISNSAGNDDGGGLAIRYHSTGVMRDCLFWGNQALDGYGGGVHCYDNADPVFSNVTFVYNYAKAAGGGLAMYLNCSPTLNNCTFDRNSTYPGGESIPFLVETLHDLPTSGSNSITPFFPADTQFIHDCRPQGGQVTIAAQSA